MYKWVSEYVLVLTISVDLYDMSHKCVRLLRNSKRLDMCTHTFHDKRRMTNDNKRWTPHQKNEFIRAIDTRYNISPEMICVVKIWNELLSNFMWQKVDRDKNNENVEIHTCPHSNRWI